MAAIRALCQTIFWNDQASDRVELGCTIAQVLEPTL
jgi:hypothetical protein